MSKTNNSALKILFSVLVFFVLTTGNIFPYIAYNGSGKGFCDPGVDPECDGNAANSSAVIMANSRVESYVEESAAYFLKAYSDILLISNRIEMANINGINFEELNQLVDNGLASIINAEFSFSVLIQVAETTPYKQNVIKQLRNFNYYNFMIENSLNSVIFQQVQDYLQEGDIRGIYKKAHSEIMIVEELLLKVKDDVSLNRMPDITDIWKINDILSEGLIFGQIVAKIFSSL